MWPTFRQLQTHYLGVAVKAPVQKVTMYWIRLREQPGTSQQQPVAPAVAPEGGNAEVQVPAEVSAPAEPLLAAKVEEPVPPASPTSVAGSDDINAMTSVVGTPTEVVHSSEPDVEMQSAVAVEPEANPQQAGGEAAVEPPSQQQAADTVP